MENYRKEIENNGLNFDRTYDLVVAAIFGTTMLLGAVFLAKMLFALC